MPSESLLTASLTPEPTAFIAAKVVSGRHCSAREVVRAAVRLLVERDRETMGAVPETPSRIGLNAR